MATAKKATRARRTRKPTTTPTTPTAGVEGRSDAGTSLPVEDQSERGEFVKVYRVQGGKPEELAGYEGNVREVAAQRGLRVTGDVKLQSAEQKGSDTVLTFTAPVRLATATD